MNGCFIMGLDGDMPQIFDDVLEFVRDSGLYEVQATFLTAFPGTPLYQRSMREDRIIEDRAWDKCTLFDINIRPRNMMVKDCTRDFSSWSSSCIAKKKPTLAAGASGNS